MSTEVVNKEAAGHGAGRITQKKSFGSSSSNNIHSGAGHATHADKTTEMSHKKQDNTHALAGLMMVKRRMGNWKRGAKAGSAIGGSSVKSGFRMAVENTYQLTPTKDEKFDEQKIKDAVEDSLRLFLVKQSAYNPNKCSQISRYISEDVKSRVKALGFKRYKFVVNVTVGQTKEQGMEFASRCIWDSENDNVATVVRQHKDMYVVVNVFGIYYE